MGKTAWGWSEVASYLEGGARRTLSDMDRLGEAYTGTASAQGKAMTTPPEIDTNRIIELTRAIDALGHPSTR